MTLKKVIVAITGATGVIYGIKLLEALRACPEAEVHLIVSEMAEKIIVLETPLTIAAVEDLADCRYGFRDMTAAVASGSYPVYGMAVVPCSMRTLAAIAHGFADNLITRAADVSLKEKRKLILAPRETPLNLIHLQNMLAAAQAGACLMPPTPAFYNHPSDIDDLLNHLTGRIMDQLDLPFAPAKRWRGCVDKK